MCENILTPTPKERSKNVWSPPVGSKDILPHMLAGAFYNYEALLRPPQVEYSIKYVDSVSSWYSFTSVTLLAVLEGLSTHKLMAFEIWILNVT